MAQARTAVVTGANRGLGFETCRQLARRGLHVVLTSRTEDGRATAHALHERGGVDYHQLDVVDTDSIAALARTLRRENIQVDVLVNNAGISLTGFDGHVARQTVDVNFFGPLRVTEGLLDLIPSGGSVVMVSSGLGELSVLGPHVRERMLDPRLSRQELSDLMNQFVTAVESHLHTEGGWPETAYGVSKAGLNALTRVLARDLEGRRIRVNAICPGWVRTDMGGIGAERSVEQGAASVVWAASESGPTGGFFRDGRPVPW
jgi:carbonyl reductase 1